MGISKIQLFVLLQDTVSHIRTGKHFARNYHHCKQEVLNAFGYDKRTPSIKLLVCIGHVYWSCHHAVSALCHVVDSYH